MVNATNVTRAANSTVLAGFIDDTLASRNEGLVTTIAASVSLFATPGVPMQASRALAVIALSRCTWDYDGELNFPTTVWPGFSLDEGLRGSYLRGAVVANVSTVFACFFLGLAVVLTYRSVLRCKAVGVAAKLSWPGVMLIPYAFTMHGIVSSMVGTFIHGNSENMDRAVALLSVVTVLCMTAGTAYIAFRVSPASCDVVERKPLPSILYNHLEWVPKAEWVKAEFAEVVVAAEQPPTLPGSAASPLVTPPRAAVLINGGSTASPATQPPPTAASTTQEPSTSTAPPPPPPQRPWWMAETPAAAHDAMYGVYVKYTPTHRGFYLVEMWTSVFISGVSGTMPTTQDGCFASLGVVMVILGLFTAAALLCKPHVCDAFHYIQVTSSVLTLLGAVISFAAIKSGSSGALGLGQALALMSGYVAVLGAVVARAYVRYYAPPPPLDKAASSALLTSGESSVSPVQSRPQTDASAPASTSKPRSMPPPAAAVPVYDRPSDIDDLMKELVPRRHQEFLAQNGADLFAMLGPSSPPAHQVLWREPDHRHHHHNDHESRTPAKIASSMQRVAASAPPRR